MSETNPSLRQIYAIHIEKVALIAQFNAETSYEKFAPLAAKILALHELENMLIDLESQNVQLSNL